MCISHFAETMDCDPLCRELAQEEALYSIIADGDPPISPLIFLNPSGEGVEVDRREGEEVDRREGEEGGSGDGEADNSGDGEAENSDDGEADNSDDGEAGEVYICMMSGDQ